jgi:hypothetical protein
MRRLAAMPRDGIIRLERRKMRHATVTAARPATDRRH